MGLIVSLGALIIVAVLVEGVLRVGFGFGNPPLYIADEHIGYLLAPNQRVRRFGNRIVINEYAMRAEAIAPVPNPHTLRLLLLGDSLANGNWWTDQPDILSARIAHYLQPSLPSGYHQVEALNVSANSWGPRNQLAYLDRYGMFGACLVVLLLNTDDLFGTQPTSLQVGRDRNYPDRKPLLAVVEVWSRFQKQPPILGLSQVQNEGGDRVGKNLSAIDGIHQKVRAANGQLIVLLSPLKRELSGPKDYELVARQRLQDWADKANVRYLDLLTTYRQQAKPEQLYRDHIHLSPAGNELVGQEIASAVQSLISTSTPTNAIPKK
ncbi:MAG: lipase family enzyme [Phormidesmis priestleyi Ana]|uniref:Lipase family enzyme n=1 Tax=Phormidesmis priestleyi Ana TaxID=1666911 RepID=A0A0P7YTD4_9CYAN|nr:MAG: lipase family enzyme [Phormidesmis priestleyi Ana]